MTHILHYAIIPSVSDLANPDQDPVVLRAERRLALLEELAEIGMEIARSLKPGAEAEETQSPSREPAAAFAQVSRAIRLTLALEAKTEAALIDWRSGAPDRREAAEAEAKACRARRKDRIEHLVLTAVAAEALDDAEFGDLYEALDERLEWDEAYADCVDRPLRETVERLCRDLQLSPDWTRWEDEGWSEADPPARSRGSPFLQPSRKPLLDADGQPLAAASPPAAAPAPPDLE